MHKFNEAIAAFEEKLLLSPDISLERTWLLHDIGRCYLELDEIEKATEYAEKSAAIAEEWKDLRWDLRANVLLGQCKARIGDFQQSANYYHSALTKARELQDLQAIMSINIVIEDITAKHGITAHPTPDTSTLNIINPTLHSIQPGTPRKLSHSTSSMPLGNNLIGKSSSMSQRLVVISDHTNTDSNNGVNITPRFVPKLMIHPPAQKLLLPNQSPPLELKSRITELPDVIGSRASRKNMGSPLPAVNKGLHV
ncbi:Tetratricopeptide repeat protein 25 [Nowakowskiella sp. JEL0078]|nr:Tetratricopeptide repeat protein 25 [Nowakowskiella sp. JEL0078]